MGDKIYLKDYWKERNLVIGIGRDNLVAIGEVIDGGEKFIHINKDDLIKTLKELKILDDYNNAILDVQKYLKEDGWNLVKELRKNNFRFYPEEVNIHARLIKEIGKLRK